MGSVLLLVDERLPQIHFLSALKVKILFSKAFPPRYFFIEQNTSLCQQNGFFSYGCCCLVPYTKMFTFIHISLHILYISETEPGRDFLVVYSNSAHQDHMVSFMLQNGCNE